MLPQAFGVYKVSKSPNSNSKNMKVNSCSVVDDEITELKKKQNLISISIPWWRKGFLSPIFQYSFSKILKSLIFVLNLSILVKNPKMFRILLSLICYILRKQDLPLWQLGSRLQLCQVLLTSCLLLFYSIEAFLPDVQYNCFQVPFYAFHCYTYLFGIVAIKTKTT